MKIAHVSESLSALAGGLQSTAIGFAVALANCGHEVRLWTARDAGEMVDGIPLSVVRLSTWHLGKLKFLRGLFDELDSFEPDLIVQHGIWSGFVVQVTIYARTRGLPYSIVTHGMLDPYILGRNRLQKKIALATYQGINLRAATVVRVLNEAERGHFAAISKIRTVVAPNGLNVENIATEASKSEDTICFLGRIDHKKGVLELIEAWRALQAAGDLKPDARLRIAGWGSDPVYVSRVQETCRDLQGVSFESAKYGGDKWEFLSSSGGFVLPSRGEGLPTAVLEAWACGALPIISPECNFDENIFGMCALRTSSDVLEICKSLREYFALPVAKRYEMRKLGREVVERDFSWPKTASRFLQAVAAS